MVCGVGQQNDTQGKGKESAVNRVSALETMKGLQVIQRQLQVLECQRSARSRLVVTDVAIVRVREKPNKVVITLVVVVNLILDDHPRIVQRHYLKKQ